MNMNVLSTALWRVPELLAQAAVPGSAQDVPDQGWGGILGVVVVFVAVCLTILIVRALSRRARDGNETESKVEDRKSRDDDDVANVTRRAH
jgi:hypothetical protein